MEDKKIQNGIKEIRKIKMTDAEKGRVLNNILNNHIVKTQNSVHSPWFTHSFMLKIHKNQLVYYMIIPLIVVLTSTGVVFASEESLPDGILYPIKVNIVEPVIGVFNLSQESKAQYESSLATKRLVEAETLASQGKLDTVKEKKINNLLEKHTSALNNAISKIKQDNSSEQVDEIVTNFNARMNAHAKVLDIITYENKNNKDQIAQKVFNNSISKNARSNANKIKDIRRDNDENVSDKYVKRKKVVDSLITATSTDINNSQDGETALNQTIVDDTNQTINEAKQYLDESVNKQNKGESKEAYKALLDSESAVKEADIFLKTRLKFKNKND